MTPQILVFDMDGVLVDVSESYRATIRRTVEYFTGKKIDNSLIQNWKNRGGWNNDWALSQQIIRELGVEIDYSSVVGYFQSVFFGNDEDGMVYRERWVAEPGLLERLSEDYQLAIFTGRPRAEAELSLKRFAPHIRFHPLVAAEDVSKSKPDPEGLQQIGVAAPGKKLLYVGDTVDDLKSAQAAGVGFVGIADPSSPQRDELVSLFKNLKADAVLDDINQLETVLKP